MAGAQTYSTLEVDPRRPEAGLEVQRGQGANAWDTESRYLQRTSDIRQKQDQQSYDQPFPQQYDDSTTKPEQKGTICGLSRRVFIIVLLISLVILIGAIAGGVAGGVLSRRDTAKDSKRHCILDESRLAAANRTVQGNAQRTVFFQDGSGALMARNLLAPSTSWTTTNLTLFFEFTEDAVTLPPGAPMAAVACNNYGCGDTRLFFLSTDQMIRDVSDDSAKGGVNWFTHGQVTDAKLRPMPGSQLATTLTERPANEDDEGSKDAARVNRLIAYQGLNGKIFVSNDSARYTSPRQLDHMPAWTTNTSLAVITQFGGTMLDEVSLVAKAPGATDASTSKVSMMAARYDANQTIWNQGKLHIPIGLSSRTTQ